MGRIILFLIPLPLFIPYLWLDRVYFWENPDSIYYINVYTAYRDALWQGEIFPHWIASTNVGFGSLVFYNLAPLPYSLTAIISAPFNLSSEHQYLLGIYAAQVFGAWAMWRWMRERYDTRLALAGAALYTLVPYKFIDIYQHFSMAQSWAVAFLPLWFHAAERLKTSGGIFAYGLAAALCFYCHALTVLSIGPLALAYALHCVQWQWRSILKPLVIAHLLALGLIASYLAAMVTASAWLSLQNWASGNFNPLNNLFHLDDFIGLYALVFAWLVYRARLSGPSIRFWSIALIVLYIIATPLSYPLWANVRLMDIFQFPFPRLQPGMGLITALFGVFLLAGKRKEYSIAVISVYVLFIFLCLMHIQMIGKRPKGESMLMHAIAIQYHVIPGIHIPIWAPINPNDLLIGHEHYAALPQVAVKDGDATADAIQKGDGWMTLHAHIKSSQATLTVAQFYIPAWKAYADGQPVEITPYTDGFIKLQLPKGEHEVRLEITKSPLERIGDCLTLLTLALYVLPLLRLCAFKRA